MVLSETAEQIRDAIKAEAHWQVVIHPSSFRADRISTLKQAWRIMEECAVHLRGDYPHVDQENRQDGPDWIASWRDYAGEREYWKFFQSGQLAHVFSFSEDSRPEAMELAIRNIRDRPSAAKPSGVIDVVALLYKITEVFEFSARLALRTKLDSPLSVTIRLAGIGGRILTKRDAHRLGYYASSQPVMEFSRTIPLDMLIGDSANVALQSARWFFEHFGWLNPPIASLRGDQQSLLTRNY